MVKVKKAVIAAAGLGTRFLPWTKAMPKEMLPLGNEPVIQHIINGLVESGVEQIAIVGGPQKRAIENHFDPSVELEQALEQRGKHEEAETIRKISEMAHFVYIGQKGEFNGNAVPLLNAVDSGFIDLTDEEPFFYMFADDFFSSDVPHAKQLLDAHHATGKSVISLYQVAPEDADKCGMAKLGEKLSGAVHEISEVIEKPGVANRPSDYAAVSGYLLTPDILEHARNLKPSKRGELELPEAIGNLAMEGKVVGAEIEGVWHDAGSPTTYAIAVLDYALNDPNSAKAIKAFWADKFNGLK